MTLSIQFTVNGRPVPWARPGLHGKRHYTPEKQKAYEVFVQNAARKALFDYNGGVLLEGPVYAHFWFYYAIPKSRKDINLADPGDWDRPGKPDWDNLGKLVSDACNKVVYHDDAQLTRVSVNKFWLDVDKTVVTFYEPPRLTKGATRAM